MNSDASGQWIAILSPLLVIAVTTATTVWYRLGSRAGKEIRTLRAQVEDALRLIHKCYQVMAAHGVPKDVTPRAPKSLIEADPWREWTRDDESGSSSDDR